MFKDVGLKKIIETKTAAGIEMVLLGDSTFSINLVILKKVKSAVVIERQQAGITGVEELTSLIDSKLPFVLVINGKGIIHRKVICTEKDSSVILLNKVLPNANLNEFDIQQTQIDDSHSIISVIRSAILSEQIEALTSSKLCNMADCLLGPFVINNLLPLIPADRLQNAQFHFGDYQLQIHENEIKDIVINAKQGIEPIPVGGNSINPQLLIAFAAALSNFTGNHNGINDSAVIQTLKDEFKQKQKFELRGVLFLATVFFILLVNYFVFNHFWAKNNEMSAILTSNQSALQQYDTLKNQLLVKKQFLERNGLLENSRTSFYADQLALMLPASIQWTDVNINPLLKNKADEEQQGPSFENKIIRISGKCQKTTDLNSWMKLIKQKNWIQAVTLMNYTRQNEAEDGQFSLQVELMN